MHHVIAGIDSFYVRNQGGVSPRLATRWSMKSLSFCGMGLTGGQTTWIGRP
jgi:hypothetical protein